MINFIPTFMASDPFVDGPNAIVANACIAVVFLLLSFWCGYLAYIAWRDVQSKKKYSNHYDKEQYSWWERNRYPFWIMGTCISVTMSITYFTGVAVNVL